MGEPTRGWMRAARAMVAVGVTVAVAGVGHALGGGGMSGTALLALVLLLAPLGVLGTGVRWTPVRAVGALGVGQVVVHALLSVMGPTTGGYAAAAHLGHGASALPPVSGASAGPDVLAMAGATSALPTLGSSALAMVVMHVVAVVVTAALLAWAEAALWSVLVRLLPSPTTPRLPTRPTRPDATRAPAVLVARTPGVRRGRAPPAAGFRGLAPTTS